jgi:hypothetical protein
MLTRRAVVAGVAAAALLALTACEPLDMDSTGQSKAKTGKTTTKSGKTTTKSGGKVAVRYETNSGGTTARHSVTVRSGSVARVTSTGGGHVSCKIVLNGRTVANKSGSGAVTCSARVTR